MFDCLYVKVTIYTGIDIKRELIRNFHVFYNNIPLFRKSAFIWENNNIGKVDNHLDIM